MITDRLRTALPVFAAVLAISACSGFRLESGGSDVDGRTVEKLADNTIASEIRGFDPKVSIQPARCPERLDLTNAKIGRCTIVVDGLALPISVKYTSSNKQITAYLDGSFFERHVIETVVGAELEQSGVTARVLCPMPAVVVFVKGTVLKCTVSVGAKSMLLQLTAADNGKVHVEMPKELGVLQDPETRQALSAHRHGERTTMSGAAVAKKIDDYASALNSALPTKHAAPHTRCPATLDLTGSNRPTCVVTIGGHEITYIVYIAKNTISWEPTETVIDLKQVQRTAVKMLSQSLEERGIPLLAKVDCGSGTAVYAVHSKIMCDVLLGADKRTLEVDVTDVYGNVYMHLI